MGVGCSLRGVGCRGVGFSCWPHRHRQHHKLLVPTGVSGDEGHVLVALGWAACRGCVLLVLVLLLGKQLVDKHAVQGAPKVALCLQLVALVLLCEWR